MSQTYNAKRVRNFTKLSLLIHLQVFPLKYFFLIIPNRNTLFARFFSFYLFFCRPRAFLPRFCGGSAAEARRINYSADFSEAVCDFSFALFINAQNSGLGVSGVEVNSGWNCTPTKKG